MTSNGVMAVILRYFSEFVYLPGVLRKSSRSLSHLLMSSCTNCRPKPPFGSVFLFPMIVSPHTENALSQAASDGEAAVKSRSTVSSCENRPWLVQKHQCIIIIIIIYQLTSAHHTNVAVQLL